MSIIKKLTISYIIFTLGLLFIGGFGLYFLGQSNDRFDYVMVNSVPSVQDLDKVISIQYASRKNIFNVLLADDKNDAEQYKKTTATLFDSLSNELKYYDNNLISDEMDKKLLDEDVRLLAKLRDDTQTFFNFYDEKGAEAAKKFMAKGGTLTTDLNDLSNNLDKHIAYNYKLANDLADSNKKAFSAAKFYQSCLTLVSLLLASLIAFSVLRYVRSSLSMLKEKIEHISQTLNLTESVPLNRDDEIGMTAKAFNALISRMRVTLSEIEMATSQVDTASAEIATSNNDLSSRTESQASSLEETAASMNQLSVTVSHNVDNAKNADNLMKQTESIFREGEGALQHLQQSINAISESSEKIAHITNIIEGIAFQTNILALNASVEAARAGENGRGFAVVAGEVRTLSQRSSAAARDIKQLIDEAINNVGTGVQYANLVTGNMDKARNAINETTHLINQVSNSSTEQSFGIDQVNQAVNQMEDGLQQNAAMVEEMASAAASLSDQANKLLVNVQEFKLH
jgi:methyl-accepting chemotaxis protein